MWAGGLRKENKGQKREVQEGAGERETARLHYNVESPDETSDQKEYFNKSYEQGLYLFNRLLN